MTGVADNTYEVIFISSGTVDTKRTSSVSKTVMLFNISGDNTYVSGDGTEKNPYVIR